jgi:hypothetical protein
MAKELTLFADQEAQAAWDRFFSDVEAVCKPLAARHRADVVFELQDHLYESFKRQTGNTECERLEIAIGKFGPLGDTVKPLIAERLFTSASRTMNPRSIALGLVFNMSRGIRATFRSIAFGLGYILSFAFLLVSLGKPFKPDAVGLFSLPGGGYSLAIYDQPPAGATELLGYWLIPIGILVFVTGYWTLSRLLGRKKTNK